MFTKNITFKNFSLNKNNLRIKKDLNLFLKTNSELLKSLTTKYKYSYKKSLLKRYKNFSILKIIGMGGSTLGTEAIFDFLKSKVKKKVIFINSLNFTKNLNLKNTMNLVISKSGNTLETITNSNILIKKKQKNLFITENRNSYINNLAKRLKSEVVTHNNFIGGRYSVLSEVGMLPAELIGLEEKKFKRLNYLIKNKKFINELTLNVSNTLSLMNQGRFNSIILNYDERSKNLFKWYQQLIAESLGKKAKGILPFVSSMPKDNHSLMQLYLDGPKKNFFTFFYAHEKNSKKINNKEVFASHNYIKYKDINKIMHSQKIATEKVFKTKKIPFRSFEIFNRNEETLGELFCFFILETILLGRALKVNPFDQPSVELIKNETKKILA